MEAQDIAAIVAGRHVDPFSVLGVHRVGDGWVARAFVPGADEVEARDLAQKPIGRLDQVHPAGVFEGRLTCADHCIPIHHASSAGAHWDRVDPYAFRRFSARLTTT